ncbi:uncharacterized protein LOC143916706 [Arctopsyche grandis]|uniref:uncharacterized protein LOC143916706 n=1 Tax=Arctopsyche grandis TaxID=121162 RepID=UPI00406D9F79
MFYIWKSLFVSSSVQNFSRVPCCSYHQSPNLLWQPCIPMSCGPASCCRPTFNPERAPKPCPTRIAPILTKVTWSMFLVSPSSKFATVAHVPMSCGPASCCRPTFNPERAPKPCPTRIAPILTKVTWSMFLVSPSSKFATVAQCSYVMWPSILLQTNVQPRTCSKAMSHKNRSHPHKSDLVHVSRVTIIQICYGGPVFLCHVAQHLAADQHSTQNVLQKHVPQESPPSSQK